MSKTNFQSIDEYHATCSGEALARMERIRATVHQLAPGVVEVISYQIPCFHLNGKTLLHYCAFAKHLTISNVWSPEFLEAFADDLASYKVSKSAIQLPLSVPFQENLVEQIILWLAKEIT